MKEYYYVIMSDTSRNGNQGIRPFVECFTTEQIVSFANDELLKKGSSLMELAGIPFVDPEDDDLEGDYERELTYEEVLKYSVEKLGDDERLCEIFPKTEEGEIKFLEAAEHYNLRQKAEETIKAWKF